jgi:hypothetical protein
MQIQVCGHWITRELVVFVTLLVDQDRRWMAMTPNIILSGCRNLISL